MLKVIQINFDKKVINLRFISRHTYICNYFGPKVHNHNYAPINCIMLKFGLSEKHTKFEKIFLMVLTNQLIYLVNVKIMRKIFQIMCASQKVRTLMSEVNYDECCSVPLLLEFSKIFPKNRRPFIDHEHENKYLGNVFL